MMQALLSLEVRRFSTSYATLDSEAGCDALLLQPLPICGHSSVIRPEARMLEAIGTLFSYAFVSKRTDGMAYEMHRLVHLASWLWLRENGQLGDTQLQVVEHLAAIFPTDEYHNRATWRAYMPHAARVRERQEHDGCGAEVRKTSQLYYKVGRCLQKDGRTKEALQWLYRSCCFRAALALAGAYRANGQTKEAIQLLEQVSLRLAYHVDAA
ncbi:uncharacterized protein K489DRAFT_213258 [Dissoconium aciculare CBS 342.82]|uniref:Uncharacterized protein n=1 Tax=Dissoconium aciculare CBS 342.82 TaxID=1314786 RepID=A0A6J3M713_9PEZI|nr:uncharacterized protein K489DRAFT_213258 [Dissoconium aciculare CBS 342.82]KAF1822652.1 hypothetical protein K489DRAFT_213258 [Dissoconium aciculare CBS 342.82]